MSTQMQAANDIRPAGDWESTPVIIKTGGGPVDPVPPLEPTAPIQCTINAEDQDFESTLLGDLWQSAMSVHTGTITKVEITENGNLLRSIEADHLGLAVLQISYGKETLIFQEVAQPDSDATKLSISSSLPFQVTDGGPSDEWRDSVAGVPPDPPFVVFTQGDSIHKIPCKSTDVEVKLDVEWDKM